MGIFDDLIRNATGSLNGAAEKNENAQTQPAASGNKTESFAFASVDYTLDAFKSLPECDLSTPFKTAALTVIALNVYGKNKELGLEMLQHISGPREITPAEKQFINDRFMDGKDYIPRSYFEGAVPGNDYTPSLPVTVRISENPYSYDSENYAKLYIKSGGADSPRQVTLRLAKDGKWYLWEQFLLGGIRAPESTDPWA